MASDMTEEEFEEQAKRLLEFVGRHPELKDALGLWMADQETCRLLHPEAAEIFEREMADF